MSYYLLNSENKAKELKNDAISDNSQANETPNVDENANEPSTGNVLEPSPSDKLANGTIEENIGDLQPRNSENSDSDAIPANGE